MRIHREGNTQGGAIYKEMQYTRMGNTQEGAIHKDGQNTWRGNTQGGAIHKEGQYTRRGNIQGTIYNREMEFTGDGRGVKPEGRNQFIFYNFTIVFVYLLCVRSCVYVCVFVCMKLMQTNINVVLLFYNTVSLLNTKVKINLLLIKLH